MPALNVQSWSATLWFQKMRRAGRVVSQTEYRLPFCSTQARALRIPWGALTCTVTAVARPSADNEAGKLTAGVAENANSTMAASTHRRMRKIRTVRTAVIQAYHLAAVLNHRGHEGNTEESGIIKKQTQNRFGLGYDFQLPNYQLTQLPNPCRSHFAPMLASICRASLACSPWGSSCRYLFRASCVPAGTASLPWSDLLLASSAEAFKK